MIAEAQVGAVAGALGKLEEMLTSEVPEVKKAVELAFTVIQAYGAALDAAIATREGIAKVLQEIANKNFAEDMERHDVLQRVAKITWGQE